MPERALGGVRVLEYAQFAAGPYCAKLLADLGAEVVKVEKPGAGDEARNRGPFLNDVPHLEWSGLFLYLNTNKLGITLNPEAATGTEVFKELVRGVDILIEDKPPQLMKELGLDYQALEAANPRLVMTSITPFGQTGYYAEYKAYCLNSYHSGLLGYLSPRNSPNLDREPIKAGGLVGEYSCGLNAALATLAALYSQRATGSGQHVDVSKQESLISLQRVFAAFYPNQGINPTRLAQATGMGGVMRCQDGYISVNFVEDHQWQAVVRLMGNPGWAQDERYKDIAFRAAHWEEIEPMISEWMLSHTREEIHRWTQESCPSGPVMSAEEVVNSAQAKARGFFTNIDHPAAGMAKYPTAPYIFSETPWAVDRSAPLLGEHNEQIYCGRLGHTRQDLVRMRQAGII